MRKRDFTGLVLGMVMGICCVNAQVSPDYVKQNSNRPVNAVGLRFGGTSGISLKHSLSEKNLVEFIAGRTNYAYGLTGLYQHLVPTTAEGLSVYFGGGAHLSNPLKRNLLVNDEGYTVQQTAYPNNQRLIFGVDGIIGVEFLFKEIPVSISADFKPYAEFYRWTNSSLVRLDPGVGLRYHF